MFEEDVEYLSKRETSKAEDQHEQLLQSENSDLPVVTEKEEEGGVKIVKCETLVKQEIYETETDSGEISKNEKLLANGRGSIVEQQEDSLVGKLKVRPFALLAEPIHLTPLFPQANLRTNSIQNVPEAPVNLTSPHSRKVRFHTETPESKENITNNGLTETQVYLRNQSLQLVSDNYRYPDWNNFPNMPAVPDRPLLMQFPARSLSFPRDIPTTSSISNSYVPLNIPSVQPRPFLQSSISEQRNVSSESMAPSLSLENASMSSEPTNCQGKEEIKIEKTAVSPETTATEVPRHSTSANKNMIVKAELDWNNFPNMPAMSDRPLLMQFPARSVSFPCDIPSTSISVSNSYVPLNIPSVPRPFLQSSISEQRNVSSENMASSLSLENATMSSEPSNYQVKEEIEIEKTAISSETTATEVPRHSTSANKNMIVKAELDLGVPGDDPEQSSLNNLNNFGNHFLTSDSICSSEQLDPYHDVDPEDLLPPSKPNGKRLCKVCDFHHDSMDAMEKHMEKLHSEKYNYRCFICSTSAYKRKVSPSEEPAYKFLSFRILEHHVATVHRGEKRYQCSTCDRNYKTRQAAINHMANVHKYTPVIDNPFACHLCSFTCKRLSTLENHYSSHNETLEECPVCLRMIKQSRMKQHMSGHNWRGNPQNKRRCGKCDYATTNIASFRKHLSLTLHNREFHCQLCRYATHFEKDFKKHTNSCNMNNRFVCKFPGCDKIFHVEKEYITHSRIHLFHKMKLHKCVNKDCDFQTLAKCHLTTHLKKTKHHLPFQCPDCTMRYSKEELVASHIQRVHVENIIQQQGLDHQVEENDSSMAVVQKDTDVGVDETDPYSHFKKGWLGMSCFEEEENMTYQPSDTLDIGSKSFSTAETQLSKCELPDDVPEFTHLVSETRMNECNNKMSDFSYQAHSNIKLGHGEVHSGTELHENIIVTPSIDLMNYAIDSEDKTSMDVVNYNPGVCDAAVQVDNFTIKPDPNLLCNPPNIERGDNTIFTPSSKFVLNHSGESYVQVDAFTVKPEPDSSENVVETPSTFFPAMQSQNLEIEGQINYIKPDPEEFPVDLNYESTYD